MAVPFERQNQITQTLAAINTKYKSASRPRKPASQPRRIQMTSRKRPKKISCGSSRQWSGGFIGQRLQNRLVKRQHPASESRLSQRVADRNREFLEPVVEFQPGACNRHVCGQPQEFS